MFLAVRRPAQGSVCCISLLFLEWDLAPKSLQSVSSVRSSLVSRMDRVLWQFVKQRKYIINRSAGTDLRLLDEFIYYVCLYGEWLRFSEANVGWFTIKMQEPQWGLSVPGLCNEFALFSTMRLFNSPHRQTEFMAYYSAWISIILMKTQNIFIISH